MVLPLCSTVLAPQQMSLRCNFPEKPSTLRALEFSDIKHQPNDQNIVGCNMLRPFGHPVAMCCDMFGVVASNLKMVKFFTQQFLMLHDVVVVWPGSCNSVGPGHAH